MPRGGASWTSYAMALSPADGLTEIGSPFSFSTHTRARARNQGPLANVDQIVSNSQSHTHTHTHPYTSTIPTFADILSPSSRLLNSEQISGLFR